MATCEKFAWAMFICKTVWKSIQLIDLKNTFRLHKNGFHISIDSKVSVLNIYIKQGT